EHEQGRYVHRSVEGMRARLQLALAQGGYSLLVGLTTVFGTAAVMWVGVRHVQDNTLTLGNLLLVMAYLAQLYEPLKIIGRKAGSLQAHLASVERAFFLLDQLPEVTERSKVRPLLRAVGAISYKNVSFGYKAHLVLHEIRFDVAAGTRVGIV